MSEFQVRSLTFFIIGLLSLAVFALDLGRVSSPIFDEERYVSSAKAFDSHHTNENWSHPILAKKIIGFFIQYFGDKAVGWRIGSAIAGAITVVLISGLAFLWSGSLFSAGIAATITLFNQALFVQSRLANLDSYMIVFMLSAVFLSAYIIKNKIKNRTHETLFFLAIGILWGLANGCKWAAAFPAIFWILFILVIYRKSVTRTVPLLGSIAVLSYFISQAPLISMWHPSYAPNLGDALIDPLKPSGQIYKAQDIVKLQSRMLIAQQTFSREGNIYQSRWYQWPFSNKPVPYFVQENTAIIYLMNPAVLFLGILGVLFSLYQGVKNGSKEGLFIGAAFLSFWLTWFFVPRLTQFTYYFLPAYLIYSLAISYSLHFFIRKKIKYSKIAAGIVVLFVVFSQIYYFDILTGRPANHEKIERILNILDME